MKQYHFFTGLMLFVVALMPVTGSAGTSDMQGAFYWDKHAYPQGWELEADPYSMWPNYPGYYSMGSLPSFRFFVDFVGGENDLSDMEGRSLDYRKSVSGIHVKKGPGLYLIRNSKDMVYLRFYVYEFETQEKLDSYFKLLSQAMVDVQVPLGARNAKNIANFKKSVAQKREQIGYYHERMDCKTCRTGKFTDWSFLTLARSGSMPFGDQSLVMAKYRKYIEMTRTIVCKKNSPMLTAVTDSLGDEFFYDGIFLVSRANWVLVAMVTLGEDFKPQPAISDCFMAVKAPVRQTPNADIQEILKLAYEKMSHHAGFPANLPPNTKPPEDDEIKQLKNEIQRTRIHHQQLRSIRNHMIMLRKKNRIRAALSFLFQAGEAPFLPNKAGELTAKMLLELISEVGLSPNDQNTLPLGEAIYYQSTVIDLLEQRMFGVRNQYHKKSKKLKELQKGGNP